MIAGCPKCAARYRIDRERLVDGAVRLRCTKCETVFRVRAPQEPSEPPKPADPMGAPPAVAPAQPQENAPPSRETPAPLPPTPAPQMPVAKEPTPQPIPIEAPAASPSAAAAPEPAAPPEPTGPAVLVAIPDAELAKQLSDALVGRSFRAIVVHDGVEAVLEIQRELPSVVVLAADLPKMFGFQVCELVKRNESLKHIHVVLIGAIHHPDRYRRPPEELYGADSYLEAPDLPDGLWQIFERAGLVGGSAPASPTEAPAPAPPAEDPAIGAEPPLEVDPPARELPPVAEAPAAAPAPPPPAAVEMPAPTPAPAAPAAAAPAPGLEEERAKAERLARIIVSDIILYNEDKFAQAVAAGTVAEALGPDLAEGRGLFEERIDPRVRGDRDYLLGELLRVARLRGME